MDLGQLPKNDLLWTALNTYRTSGQTKTLKSEKHRSIFADDFQTSQMLTLATICLKKIADNYRGHPIRLQISPIQLRTLYDFIDVDLPLEKCINIHEECYWKRVCTTKCSNKILLQEKTKENCMFWMRLGVTLKLVELIESTPYEIWNHDEMEKITKLASAYVTEMKISKLQAMRDKSFQMEQQPVVSEISFTSEERERSNPEALQDEVKYEYPPQVCHHVDLSIVKNLIHLHALTLEFIPPELGIRYHSRYFDFSYVDMQNLASGISELVNLKVFKIRRSRMDSFKLSTILEALKSTFVEHLEFYFCQLDDECGESLYEFQISTAHLKRFNLAGNYFRDSGVVYLANGIRKGPSKISHFDLSNNPISDESLCDLTNALLTCKYLTHVALSGIKVSNSGAACMAYLVKMHPNLEELEIIAVPMDGCTLIPALESNTKILKIICRGCGLRLEEEFKIDLLLKRNRYIKENPYIGDTTRTEQEINDFVSRIKNPILLNALGAMEKWADCRQKIMKREKSKDPLEVEKCLTADESDSSTTINKFCYKSSQFTEQDLDQRVSLYGQNEKNFFKKQGHCQINQ